MGRTLDRSVLVGIGLIVALLVSSAALNYRNTRRLNDDAGWVARTHEVLDLTSDVLLTIVDAETGDAATSCPTAGTSSYSPTTPPPPGSRSVSPP